MTAPDPATHPDPEAELLLRVSRLELRPEDQARIAQLLAAGIDWERLLELAEAHGLRPLLFRHLDAVARSAMPREIETRLWSHQQQLRQKNRRMADELVAIVQLLESNGIPALPYKGPVLAMLVYGDLALREFGDLDLLLPKDCVARAKTLLADRGYAPYYPMSAQVEAAFLRAPNHYHLMLMRGQREMLLELHWKTNAEFPVEPANDPAWWAQLATVRFDDRDVRCFAAHELVLALCLHGSKHHWTNLNWLVDVAEYVRQQPALDWSWILARADRLRAGRRLALGLHLLRRPLDLPLPAPVQTWLADYPAMERLACVIAQGWFALPRHDRSGLQRLRLNFQLYQTPWQRLRHAGNMLLRPSLVEWSRWPLPRPLFILYLPMRAGRLFGKQARGLFRKRR